MEGINCTEKEADVVDEYRWDGFWELEVEPSPKVQDQEVGELAEVSVKFTINGLVPDVGDAKKPAEGA